MTKFEWSESIKRIDEFRKLILKCDFDKTLNAISKEKDSIFFLYLFVHL